MSEIEENKVQIAYYGSKQFRNRLQKEALERGVKVQALIDSAIEAYLADSNSASTVLPPTGDSSGSNFGNRIDLKSSVSRPHALLDGILSNAPALIRDAILGNLEAFSLVTEVVTSGEKPESAGDLATAASGSAADVLRGVDNALASAKAGKKRRESEAKGDSQRPAKRSAS